MTPPRRFLRAAREPSIVLGPLILLQWLAVVVFALTVRHNGWLYYQGGDETWYYTTSWVLHDGAIPPSKVGYAWPLLLLPVPFLTGPNLLLALPFLIAFQFIVLLPIALLCVYGIAARIGGRLLGYAAATLWVVAPFAAIPLFVDRYHERYVEQFLPQALGLTGLADFPSTVCLLVAAYFAVRTIDTGALRDAVVTGLAAGFAIGIKPANGLFVLAPILGFAVARRWRALLPFAAAIVPALATLALWKYRGYGYVPGLIEPDTRWRVAAGATIGVPEASVFAPITRYVSPSWEQLSENFLGFREFFWSMRLIQWLPLAGAIAVARVSFAKAALLGAWLAAFFLIKGGSEAATVESGSFFRLLMPAFPAFLLLAVSIPLLIPTVGPRIPRRFPAMAPGRRVDRRLVAAGAIAFALVPLVLIAILSPLRQPTAVYEFESGVSLPIDTGFSIDATRTGQQVRISWRIPDTAPTGAFFRVLRSPYTVLPDPSLPPAVEGIRCKRPQGKGADQCALEMNTIGTTAGSTFGEGPPRGRWTYRVAMAANWINDPELGDILMLSPPANVRVP